MKKIKQFIESEKGKDMLTILIVILVGLGAFQLGRLSKENDTNSLKIDYTAPETSQTALNQTKSTIPANTPKTTQNSVSGEFFGSNRGSKYYPINCSAGKNIKEENRIYFSSTEDAEKAGYELSTSC